VNEIYQVELPTPPAIIEADSRRSDEVRKRVQELDSTLTLSAFEQGDLFAEIKGHSYWNDWKFESFPDYLKKSGVDLSPREIEYRITISRVAKSLKVNKTLLAKARISKCKEIFSLNPEETVTDTATLAVESMADIIVKLVADAPNKSLKEIREIVKRLKGINATEEDIAGELTWINLPVRRDAKQIVVSAIELAVALSGTTLDMLTKEEKDISQAAALERISADFMASPDNQLEGFTQDEDSVEFEDSIEDSDGEDEDESDEDSDENEDENEDDDDTE
jgi:hypothetical protein